MNNFMVYLVLRSKSSQLVLLNYFYSLKFCYVHYSSFVLNNFFEMEVLIGDIVACKYNIIMA